MSWQKKLNGDTISWLIDDDEPGLHYLVKRDLLDLSAADPELISAQEAAHNEGPITTILAR